MQGTDVLVPLAEIAGVFVGFGALIAVRSGATMAVSEIVWMRYVMMAGIWVVIAALAPTIIGSYGVAGHELWLTCSLLALALFAAMVIVFTLTPENQAERARQLSTAVSWRAAAAVYGSTVWVPMPLLLVALALVVLGPFPDQEQALYLTAVAVGLYMGAIALFVAVFWQEGPAASDRVGLEAPGGSSA
jgi:hypothetical protein